MKGTVEKIWPNKTKDGKKYWVLSIGGENYSVWDKKIVEGLQEGDAVEYEWAQSGDFKKVTDLKRIEIEPSFEKEKKQNYRDRQILRLSCIKSAAALVSGFDAHPNEKSEITIGIARKFEEYVREVEKEESHSG